MNASDLFGSKIYPGSRVNVNWGGEWYDGAVVKIGPQYNLCKVQPTRHTLGVGP